MASGEVDDNRTCNYCGRSREPDSAECPRCGNVFRKQREA